MHYVVTTHTDHKIVSKTGKRIFIKIIGNLNKTEFIPLQHSQTNNQPFLSSKKDVFDITAVDVGHVCINLYSNFINFRFNFDYFRLNMLF